MKPLTALAVPLFAAIALLFTSPPASATFPGENGRLALVWTYEPPEEVTTDVILTAGAATGVKIDDVTVCDFGCHSNSPDWSPSGRRLAFVQQRFEDDLSRLVTARADGSDVELVYEPPRGAGLSDAAWSPGGDRIAFTRHWRNKLGHFVSDVYVVRRSGNHLMRLTHTPLRWEAELDWSSENRLVFRSQHGPWLKKRSELFTMRPDGRGLHRLTHNTVRDSEPNWAPGGKRLVFVHRHEIWLIGLWGKGATTVAQGRDPTWAPDGSRIAYVGVDGLIHTIEPAGEGDVVVGSPVTEGFISQLDWRPR